MSQKGQCPNCQQENEYSKINCDFCGCRLPWADAIQKSLTPQKPQPSPPVPRTPVPHGSTEEQERLAGRMNETLDKADATRDKLKDYVQSDGFKTAAKREAACLGNFIGCFILIFIVLAILLAIVLFISFLNN